MNLRDRYLQGANLLLHYCLLLYDLVPRPPSASIWLELHLTSTVKSVRGTFRADRLDCPSAHYSSSKHMAG